MTIPIQLHPIKHMQTHYTIHYSSLLDIATPIYIRGFFGTFRVPCIQNIKSEFIFFILSQPSSVRTFCKK